MFENRYYTTQEIYKEYVRKVLCHRIFRLGSIFFVIGAVAMILSLQEYTVNAAMIGTALFVLLFTMLLGPKLMLKQLMDVNKRLHNGQSEECIISFDEDIKINEGKQSLAIEYSQITNIYRMKTCSVLMFTKQNGIIYLEDKFTKGNAEEFEGFILGKCSQVKGIEQR
jgi:hypothetical protein